MRRIAVALALATLTACATDPYAGSIQVPVPAPPGPIAELIEQLSAPDPRHRASAAWGLAGVEKADSVLLTALQAARDHENVPVREGAAWALGHVAPAGSEARKTDLPPKLLFQRAPTYPRTAFDQKIEGTVLLEILISEAGRVAHVEVRRSVPSLDRAALEC